MVLVTVGTACFVVGFMLGTLWYGWMIASSLAKGRLPETLKRIGFTLPKQYEQFKQDERNDDAL